MAKTRFLIAKDDIVKTFDGLSPKVLTRKTLAALLAQNRVFWRLPVSMTLGQFAELMVQHTTLRKVLLRFPHRSLLRYTWGDRSVYEVAFSIADDAYLTHFSAMRHHELTEQVPTVLYLNAEQPPKRFQDRELNQEAIDRAFRLKPRISKMTATYRDMRVCLLNGMQTGQLGVIDSETPDGVRIRVTNVERTLIDIAVRPFYGGGVFEVLEAYRRAVNKLSVNKLTAMLKTLDYIYPYHQAIGFYLERADVYRESQISLLEELPRKLDFYLVHNMKEKAYSSKWRLYYPAGL